MRNRLITLSMLVISMAYLQGQTKNPSYEAYINKYKDLAIQHQKLYKIPASIKLAQGILETAAGSSRLARQANNHFGIKCKEEWTGPRIYHDDDEKNECFRAYKSAEESYLDHSLFLSQRKYYVSLFKLDILDYKGWANGLQSCGYATDRLYGTKLIRIIEQYDLHKYDRGGGSLDRIYDDAYEVKLKIPGLPDFSSNWKRRIHLTNNIHYITAQKNDTYEIIAYDANMKLKRLLKYNEVDRDHKLAVGDIVFLQSKKKQASKEHRIHVVQRGESLYSISQMYGMKLKSVYKLNKLKDDFIPKAGDTLRVRK